MRLRDLGSYEFAWSDLRAIVKSRRFDSALSRAINPDRWFWDDPQTHLAAESATMLSAIRFWTVLGMRVFDSIPEEYTPVRYGPPREETVDESADEREAASVELSRSVAGDLRAVA